mmetsp:Transcript_57908/g.167861  ORF Transcript_57908/g.167861 Transcript_57908/m.167861 type:complete len:235 (-) Transcript_57908:516-1220(-)
MRPWRGDIHRRRRRPPPAMNAAPSDSPSHRGTPMHPRPWPMPPCPQSWTPSTPNAPRAAKLPKPSHPKPWTTGMRSRRQVCWPEPHPLLESPTSPGGLQTSGKRRRLAWMSARSASRLRRLWSARQEYGRPGRRRRPVNAPARANESANGRSSRPQRPRTQIAASPPASGRIPARAKPPARQKHPQAMREVPKPRSGCGSTPRAALRSKAFDWNCARRAIGRRRTCADPRPATT